MAIYDDEEFNRVKCSYCGGQSLYEKTSVSLTKFVPRPHSAKTDQMVDEMTEYEKSLNIIRYFCYSCNRPVATYDPSNKNQRWTFD